MKSQSLLIYFLALTILTASMCRKKPVDPIDQLPPETQTGANTFGCLVNGEVFLPGGLQLSGGSLNCVYQYIYNGTTNGYVFGISGGKRGTNCAVESVGVRLDSMIVQQGVTYPLTIESHGYGNGQYFIINVPCGNLNTIYQTNNSVQGSITFLRFDLNNQIASGTFWFNAINPNGDTIKVTNGRFDVHYTR